jgi:signal transduction histidine kinase
MRSIRRSLTVYLFALLAVTLAAVWVVIDQVVARSLAAREAAESALLHARFDERCREELARTDKALFDQANRLGGEMQREYRKLFDAEFVKFQAFSAAAQLSVGVAPVAANPFAPRTGGPPGPGRWSPATAQLFRLYFANLPIPDDLVEHLDDEKDYFQINTSTGREWRSASLAARKLPFDPKDVDPKPAAGANVIDWTTGPAEVGPGAQPVRRVLYKIPYFASTGPFRPQPRGGPGGRDDRKDDRPPPGGPQDRSRTGAYTAWVLSGFVGPPPPGLPPSITQAPPPDSLPRLYIQCARPQATIDAAVAGFAAQRDDDLARLAADLRETRQTLRTQVATVGLAAFLAVAVGAPVLVGRGLRPVGNLSDAVSRVSEKDFSLPHDGAALAVELAPIRARLTQTLDLLRRAFAREKQAVADISHELRTPIAALMATLDVALRKPRTPEQYESTLKECRVITAQLGQLVERIMTLASLDAGNDRTLVSRTDAAELAAGCAAVIRPLAAANNLSLTTRVDDALDLDTDSGKLREVLMNLLHNAVEYNRPGGTIELTARRDGAEAVFEVRDTGIGMPAEVREKIFERFYRADPSRHATGVHAGLGLAIVKEYVARLGGTLVVESAPGEGSTFRVTLPAPPAEPWPDAVAETAAAT